MLTVSMPTYRTPMPLLLRAVDSVLEQDVPLRLVVVNDGGPHLELPDRPQATVLNLTENHGRYFADAVVLAACDTEWFTVHDADDWSDPGRYRRLIDSAATTGAVIGPYVDHRGEAQTVVQPRPFNRAPRTFTHITHWASGVYSTERMHKAGGIHPGFRIGYDTLHTLMMILTGPVAVDTNATYHYCHRPGSLTTSTESNRRSPDRRRAGLKLAELYYVARAGSDPGTAIRRNISPSLRTAVIDEAKRLRALL